MPYVHATILGGLPIVAQVWYSGPDYQGEYDCGVDAIFWRKRDGSRGKEVSQAIYDKLDRYDEWWQASVTEEANDWLGQHCPTRYANPHYDWRALESESNPRYITEGKHSPDFRLLNPLTPDS